MSGKAFEMAARLGHYANALDTLKVEPSLLQITRYGAIAIQLANEDDVDAVATLLDAAPDERDHPNYTRRARIDGEAIEIYSGRHRPRCSCGHACDHTREARDAAESAEVEASLARTDAFARANPGSGVTS